LRLLSKTHSLLNKKRKEKRRGGRREGRKSRPKEKDPLKKGGVGDHKGCRKKAEEKKRSRGAVHLNYR